MSSNVENSIWLAKRMLVDSIWSSANVEGLGTTFPDTECIIRGVPTETTYEETTFIINMKRGWEFLIENYNEPNSLMFIRTLHEIICKGLVRNAGSFRDGIVRITGCDYTPPVPNTGVVYDDMNGIDSVQSGIQKAMVMFCYLAKSQLFWDGNKRMAQLMCNKILMQEGIGIMSIPVKSVKEFSGLLVKYYSTGDAKSLMNFLIGKCLQRA